MVKGLEKSGPFSFVNKETKFLVMANVYLICNPATGQYKIGVSKDVQKRLKQLQTGNGCELHIVASFESSYPYYVEKMLHRHFQKDRTEGEWFYLDEHEDLSSDFMDSCNHFEAVANVLQNNQYFNKMANIK